MIVTFVSQCEKKAIAKTQRILDTFANRIGDRTWQTVITSEGLMTVKRMLSQSATKNTAVSCHWLRARTRIELIWIVGNRRKFSSDGTVPVHTTSTSTVGYRENDWLQLPLIKNLAGLAALFHDWGKSSELFQDKLVNARHSSDPLRHEWVSLLFFSALVGNRDDSQWLQSLADFTIDLTEIRENAIKNEKRPLRELPPLAGLIAWLIVTHHRLPGKKQLKGEPLDKYSTLFGVIDKSWGYENNSASNDFNEELLRCFSYPNGLPAQSPEWRKAVQRTARKTLRDLNLLEDCIKGEYWRLVMLYSRLSLMLGDHHYSSQPADKAWQSDIGLFANTDRLTRKPKQKLDEHLVGVARQAVKTAHWLPAFENSYGELPKAYDVKALARKSPANYRWQDKAVAKIDTWRLEPSRLEEGQFGFFAVNMASTGKGKTFANAKIMRSLSEDRESLRYVLALGLRTLTLQTGDEYRKRIGLTEDQLAVIIGSKAIMELHHKADFAENNENHLYSGSESEEKIIRSEVHFDTEIPENQLTTLVVDQRSKQFLYAPILCCTIDHLMSATETKRGGKYILPTLRLMSSDLVIDEIDDFAGNDLIAIGRLIHLAGMLGRKVMISSATITPDLAEGYFNAYQGGWKVFAKMRGRSGLIGCAWIDEFRTIVKSNHHRSPSERCENYRELHKLFIEKRDADLSKIAARRKGNIIDFSFKDVENEDTIKAGYFETIHKQILVKHSAHHTHEASSDKKVSFGLVRMANIKPCIELTRYLLNADWPDGVEIRAMAYHSQQILVMRDAQEKHLDAVLNRTQGSESAFSNKVIRQHIEQTSASNLIFILVATPVEEVGRDHDFDWAIVEPSSYRSLIQLAGRILRHRKPTETISKPNIGIMQYNLRAALHKGEVKRPCFCWPGYESSSNLLESHDLRNLLDSEAIASRIDARPRIQRNEMLYPKHNLVDLEHRVISDLLTSYEKRGPETLEGWISGEWWFSCVPQLYVRFRDSTPQITMFLMPKDSNWVFSEIGRYGEIIARQELYGIKILDDLSDKEERRLWLKRDYHKLLVSLDAGELSKTARVYGEINLPTYGKPINELNFCYSSQFGLWARH